MNRIIQSEKELTLSLINEIVSEYNTSRFSKLQDYYDGISDITGRERDKLKPNNKLVSNYPAYIVDLMTGYSTGKPVAYTSQEDSLMDVLQDIFDYNDEQDENAELDKIRSIKGVAYELVYLDEEGNIRFNGLDPENLIAVYDTKIVPDMRFAIRFYTLDEVDYIEVYDTEYITRYIKKGKDLTIIDQVQHYAGQVPVIEYRNNNELVGDFEKVMSLIDAYDKIQSDTVNDMELLADAYLVLEGMQGTTNEDLIAMRESRAFMLPPESKAYYLLKQINDTALENMKSRLNEDIHKFSKVIDVSDDKFGGNASGVAMKYKLLALEQVVAMKERKFKRGLQKRLELICQYLNLKGGNYDYKTVNIKFTRNIPVNELESVDMAIKLKGIVSDKTALSILPFVEDVNRELEMLENERELYSIAYPETISEDENVSDEEENQEDDKEVREE